MDIFAYIGDQVITYLNIPFILTFIFAMQGVKKYVPFNENKELEIGSKFKLHIKYVALLVGTILLIPFYFLGIGEGEATTHATEITKLLVSYTVATSLYELLLKKVFSFLKIGSNESKSKDQQLNS